VALRVLRQASAQTRYAIACAGLLVALAAPVATVGALLTDAASISAAVAPVAGTMIETVDDGTHVVSRAVARVTDPRTVPLDNDTLASALSVFVSFWAAGVLLLTLRLASGWWRVRRLHADALLTPASDWLEPASQIAGKLGLLRAIHVVDSVHVDTPTVIGWLRPVVLLPIAALANLTPGQVEAILAHELAHIRRHDFIVNLLQTIAETVLFYHPAIWWLSERIRTEREHCCDDIAVDVCGDALGYAEALTALAAWGRQRSVEDGGGRLAIAATGGPLLHRVRRLLRLPDEGGQRRPVIPLVIATTVLFVLLVGTRLVIVAQTPSAVHAGREGRLGPPDINRILGYDLFPGPAQYVTDEPRDARAWDVKVAYPGGEMSFLGFTGRSLIRYAYALDMLPVMDGPAWIDAESMTIRGETSTDTPGDDDFRAAIRAALEGQYGISIRRDTRLFPVYGLQPSEPGRLGPNVRPSSLECVDSVTNLPQTLGPTLHARGEAAYRSVQFCGIDATLTGFKGRRATFEQFARSLRGFGVEAVQRGVPQREVVDQTGLTGVYDFDVHLGLLPLAAIATQHPTLGIGFGPMIRTIPQAIEEQLGLRLVPSEAPRDIVVIVSARQQLQAQATHVRQLAAVRQGR
jgi:uncharacterized protein (TIGR03435 family)